MTYDGNRLVKCDDAVSAQPTNNGAHHFTDLADEDEEYEYDGNGNMTKDLNREITSIEYNSLNLPRQITFSDATKMKLTYDAAGNKLRAEYWTIPTFNPGGPIGPVGIGGGNEPMGGGIVGPILPPINQNDPQVVTNYCGNLIYRNDTLSMLLTEEGYVTFDERGEPLYHYYLKDHLGSVRVVLDGDGTVEQVNDYYPSGTLMYTSTNGTVQPYKFGQKELERTLPLDEYDFGARWMDPVIGARFTTMDPMCEKYYSVSPYAYCHGDPVNLIDPDGRENIVVVGSNNNNNPGSKLMFINQGIAQIRRNYENYGSESNTMVLFKAGYSNSQIDETRKAIAKYGATLKIVDSAQEFIEYVNTGNDRQNDLITNMTIFSHGQLGSIEFGYHSDQFASTYILDKDNVSDFSSSAFKGSKSTIMSFACRSGLGPGYGLFDYDTENSIAQQMANSTGARVGAFLVRTDYSDTLGTRLERWIGGASSHYKTVGGAILTPDGALNPVKAGSTPLTVLKSFKVFTPK